MFIEFLLYAGTPLGTGESAVGRQTNAFHVAWEKGIDHIDTNTKR